MSSFKIENSYKKKFIKLKLRWKNVWISYLYGLAEGKNISYFLDITHKDGVGKNIHSKYTFIFVTSIQTGITNK